MPLFPEEIFLLIRGNIIGDCDLMRAAAARNNRVSRLTVEYRAAPKPFGDIIKTNIWWHNKKTKIWWHNKKQTLYGMISFCWFCWGNLCWGLGWSTYIGMIFVGLISVTQVIVCVVDLCWGNLFGNDLFGDDLSFE